MLIDYDTARLYRTDRTVDTQVLETRGLAAPEQYGLSQSDHRADIYATSVLLNAMLTGELPSRRMTPGR